MLARMPRAVHPGSGFVREQGDLRIRFVSLADLAEEIAPGA
jgi:hypothetical protein